jgi:hypothetical protein
MNDAIRACNADLAAAHTRFVARRPPPAATEPARDMVAWLRERQDKYDGWKRESGYNRYMKLALAIFRRKHGFVRCADAPGWRFAG